MKILFINLSELKFTVATPETEPLGGSESCLCYLARQLASTKHDVTVLARLPDNAPSSVMGIRHVSPLRMKDPQFFAAEKFDVIIANNAAVACAYLRHVSPASRILLWNHVTPDQRSAEALGTPETVQSIDAMIYVSEWQKRETENKLRYSPTAYVIGNGLTPAFENMFSSPAELLAAKNNRAAYTTTPYRGLPLLVEIMKRARSSTTLDIFSSLRVYQASDDEFAPLFQALASNPRITCHGSVSQPELAQRLKSAAFLTYPSIFAETYSISVLEALAAGLKVITTRLGALESTTMGFADLVDIEPGNPEKLINDFTAAFDQNVEHYLSAPEQWATERFAQMQQINETCRWAVRAAAWEKLF